MMTTLNSKTFLLSPSSQTTVATSLSMFVACIYILHTCNTGVIHQDDLFKQYGRRCVQDAVDRPEEGRPSLVVEDNNNAGGRQRRTVTELPFHTPE